MPKISIVMPVFNGEQFLREAIDSVINQTFTDWEFIIVSEFGSNESASKILLEYEKKESRITIIWNTSRLRISASLNAGINASKGKYIARMDADDICAPNRLQIQYEYMEAHPEIDICGLEPTMFGEADWKWGVETDASILRSDTLFFTPFVHPTIMIRAETLNEKSLRYDESFHYTEDYEFFERASSSLRYANIADCNLYSYRMHSKNATNVGGNEGIQNYLNVTKRAFERIGLTFTAEELDILCVHTWKEESDIESALEGLSRLDLLLKKIWWSKAAHEMYGIHPLFKTLHKRWMRTWERYQWNKNMNMDGRIKAAIDRGLFAHENFYEVTEDLKINDTPLVSVVIPTFNSEKYVQETVFSLLEQTLPDFEILVVNEFGSNDRTVELIKMFADPRVHIIQNETRLGLADSLNEGIRKAKGTYVARADADDLYPKNRIETQVNFLKSHPEISLCGSYQRHFGKRNFIHAPVEKPEQLKAMLIFKCDVCHSTIMFRKDDFVKNNLFYDKSFAAEDYELWTRAVEKLKFYTIPEILGEYRWDGDNITATKMEKLLSQEQKIVARTLKKLGIEIKDKDLILLSGWKNPFQDYSRTDRSELITREEKLLSLIEQSNKKKKIYDKAALHECIAARRQWMLGNGFSSEIEEKGSLKCNLKLTIKKFLKKRLRFLKPILSLLNCPALNEIKAAKESLQKSIWDSEGHLQDSVKRLENVTLEGISKQADSFQKSIWDSEGHLQDSVKRLENVTLEGISKQADSFQKSIWDSEGHIKDLFSIMQYQMDAEMQYQMNAAMQVIYILGTPFSSNLGDIAQTVAIREWCRAHYPNYSIIEFQCPRWTGYGISSIFRMVQKNMKDNDIIIIQGGIRVSDLYENELEVFLAAISSFPDKKIIAFPTTIRFSDTGKAKRIAEMSDLHGNVTILARDRESEQTARDLFDTTPVIFCPDIVHYLYGKISILPATKKRDVLLVKRDADKECLFLTEKIEKILSSSNFSYDIRDTVSDIDADFLHGHAKKILAQELKHYAESSVIVTDRMHGMIFGLLANIPVIVLPTSTGKTQSAVAIYSKNVYLCSDVSNLPALIEKAISAGWIEFSEAEVNKWMKGFEEIKEMV